MANAKYYGTGRRKKSVARVYLVPGTGKITINKRDIDEYLGLETLKVVVRQPLVATGTTDKFDVIVNVHGGGYTGQAGAIRHGISRALLEADAEYRPVLKNVRNTVSRQLVEHLSSARDNRTVIEIAGKPWKHHVSGVFLFALETRWNGGKPGENHRISSAFVTRLQQKYLYSRVLFMASIRIRTSRWV